MVYIQLGNVSLLWLSNLVWSTVSHPFIPIIESQLKNYENMLKMSKVWCLRHILQIIRSVAHSKKW